MRERAENNVRLSTRVQAWLAFPRARWFQRHLRQLSPSHWRRKQSWAQTVFRLHRTSYSARWKGREALADLSLTAGLIRQASRWVLLAIVLVGTLAGIEQWVNHVWPTDWPRLPLVLRDEGAYAELVSGIVGLTGTLLGLYFAALSLVASTAYKDVPTDVREALIRDRAGTLYIKLIALACACGVIMLGVAVLGFPVGVTNHITLVLLATVGVFGFVALGVRSFAFFDPTQLTHQLEYQIFQSVRSATPAGFRWDDPSFQATYQRNAEAGVRSYQNIASVTANLPTLGSEPIREFAQSVLVLLQAYADEKPRIPMDSYWFRRVAHHRSWFTADHSYVDIALQTDGAIPFESKPDYFWLEAELEPVLFKLVRALLTRGHPEETYRVGSIAQHAVASLTKRLQLEEATRLHRGLLGLAREEARRDAGDSDQPQVRLRRLAAVTDFAGGIRSMITSLGLAAEELTTDAVAAFARETVGQAPGAPIGRSVPPLVRETIVTLRKQLSFEVAAEGVRVTPDWYLAEIVAIAYARFLVESIDLLATEIEEWYPQESKALLGEKRVDFAIHTVQGGLDLCRLLLHHAHTVATAIERLSVLSSHFHDQPWPSIDHGRVSARIENVREQLLATLATATPHLPADVPTGELPDITGFAYTILAQECYFALTERRSRLFAQLYPAFFGLVIVAEKRLRTELRTFPDKSQIALIADLFVDLFEISGFALVFHQLDGGTAWRAVTTAWKLLLAEDPNPRRILDYALKLVDFRRDTHRMSTRYLVRTGWLQDFQRRMQERGLSSGLLGTGPARAEPISLIAAVMARSGMTSPDAADAFVGCYILKLPQAQGLTPPASVKEFS